MSSHDEGKKSPSRGASFSFLGTEDESEPLLHGMQQAGPSRRYQTTPISNLPASPTLSIEDNFIVSFHSSDENAFFDFIMEKVRESKIGCFFEKLAVDSEPGLTNAQLMLNNHDLKPVEQERRQWGAWNFVGFWVSDSFNIVCCPTLSLS